MSKETKTKIDKQAKDNKQDNKNKRVVLNMSFEEAMKKAFKTRVEKKIIK